MSVKICYFASIREAAGRAEERIDLPAEINSVADLMAWLGERHEGLAAAFAATCKVRAAIDHEHVPLNASVVAASEIAFFPPLTGG